MAELRLVAISQKTSDEHMLEAMRYACSHANRDFYVGECPISASHQDAELYAEIVYLLNELATNGTKNGLDYTSVFLKRIKKTLQDLLPEDSIRDAEFHEDRFWAIHREEDEQLRDKKLQMEDGWNPLAPLNERYKKRKYVRRSSTK